MGLSQSIACPAGIPPWIDVLARLQAAGCPAAYRMIDGQLALPDETPGDDWAEVRLGTPAGMVTVRRVAGGVEIVTWGNADPALRAAMEAVGRAFVS